MFILRDLLIYLQAEFSNTDQGQKKSLVCIHITGGGGSIFAIF